MTHDDIESLRPSPEAEAILRTAGWTPDRTVDASEWVDRLRRDGNHVPPVAEAIMKSFGGLHLEHQLRGGASRYDLQLNPSSWFGERDRVKDLEDLLRVSACPLGEISGDGLLAVLDDGRIISEFEGDIDLVGGDWSSALDLIVLGRGVFVPLAKDYVPVECR